MADKGDGGARPWASVMRNRDLFLPSVTTLILFAIVWFLSCAHQNRWREEADMGGYDEATAENQSGDEQASADQMASSAQAPEQTQSSDGFALSSEKSEKSDLADQKSMSAEDTAFAAVTNESPSTESTESSPSLQGEPQAQTQVTSPEVVEPKASSEPEVVDVTPPIINEDSSRKVWRGKTPKIPKKALLRKGLKLNRFYFVRKGDNPKKVSQLIYNDKKHSVKLTSWNGKKWAPGKILYYSSPVDPSDSTMRSFYQENRVTPQEYQVKAGDWLTRIAGKKLGSFLSWKEIAVVNGLKSPSAIEVGQKLAIYPKDLSSSPAPQPEQPTLAQSQEAPSVSKPTIAGFDPSMNNRAESNPAPQMEQPAPVVQDPAPVAEPTSPSEEASAEVAEGSSGEPTNWNQIVEQNSVAILIGAALIVLILALSARKKRLKNKASSGGGEEPFPSETESKIGRRR